MYLNVFCHDWLISESYGRLVQEVSSGIERLGAASINRIGRRAPEALIRPTLGGILTGYPSAFHLFGEMANNGPRIALTMFESTAIPQDWIEPLNEVDAVIVPSEWLVEVFQKSGVKVPIHVVPLGISGKFHYQRRRTNPKFRIMAIGDRGLRKGSHKVLFSFVKAFRDDPTVELLLKAKDYPITLTNPNIKILRGDYTDVRLARTYRLADLFVFPSAGEGFGFPPREAARSGALVMATDFSGTHDGLTEWGVPLPYTMTKAWVSNSEHKELGEWADVDVDHLSEMMVWARNLPLAARNAIGKKASDFISAEYTWDRCAAEIFRIWQDVLEKHYANRLTA